MKEQLIQAFSVRRYFLTVSWASAQHLTHSTVECLMLNTSASAAHSPAAHISSVPGQALVTIIRLQAIPV